MLYGMVHEFSRAGLTGPQAPQLKQQTVGTVSFLVLEPGVHDQGSGQVRLL